MMSIRQALALVTAAAVANVNAAAVSTNMAALANRGALFNGDMTFTEQGLGACGITNSDGDAAVAISHLLFDPQTPGSNPNNNPLCKKQIKINLNGKSVTASVTDRCQACAMYDIDVSPSVFSQLDDPSVGRVGVEWDWA